LEEGATVAFTNLQLEESYFVSTWNIIGGNILHVAIRRRPPSFHSALIDSKPLWYDNCRRVLHVNAGIAAVSHWHYLHMEL
jgi:hypothetical protein